MERNRKQRYGIFTTNSRKWSHTSFTFYDEVDATRCNAGNKKKKNPEDSKIRRIYLSFNPRKNSLR